MKMLRAILDVVTKTFWDAFCVWMILFFGGLTVVTSFILGFPLDDAFILVFFTIGIFVAIWAFGSGIIAIVKEVIKRYKSE